MDTGSPSRSERQPRKGLLISAIITTALMMLALLAPTAAADHGGEVTVSFAEDCSTVTVTAEHDISNVSYTLDNGSSDKLEGGFTGSETFAASDFGGTAFVYVQAKASTSVGEGSCEPPTSSDDDESTDDESTTDDESADDDESTDDGSTDDESTDDDESTTDESTDHGETSQDSAAVISADFFQGCSMVRVASTKDISYFAFTLDTGESGKLEGGFDETETFGAAGLGGDMFVEVEVKSGTTVELFLCDGSFTTDDGDGPMEETLGPDAGDGSDVLGSVDERPDADAVLGDVRERPVVAVDEQAAPEAPEAEDDQRATAKELAFTGAEHWEVALYAIALLAAGGLMLLGSRRLSASRSRNR